MVLWGQELEMRHPPRKSGAESLLFDPPDSLFSLSHPISLAPLLCVFELSLVNRELWQKPGER